MNHEFYTNVLEKMLCKQSHPGSWTRQKKMTDRINYMNSTKNRVRDTNEIKKKPNNYRKKPFISRRNLPLKGFKGDECADYILR